MGVLTKPCRSKYIPYVNPASNKAQTCPVKTYPGPRTQAQYDRMVMIDHARQEMHDHFVKVAIECSTPQEDSSAA